MSPKEDCKGKMYSKITNFLNLRKSHNKKILFVCKSHLDNRPIMDDVSLLYHTLLSFFSVQSKECNNTFDILIVNEYKSDEKIIEYYTSLYKIPECDILFKNIIQDVEKNSTQNFLLNCNVLDNMSVVDVWKNQIFNFVEI